MRKTPFKVPYTQDDEDAANSTISGKPQPGQNRYIGEGSDDSGGAGRGKVNPKPVKMAKGGRVTGYRGYGKAKKV